MSGRESWGLRGPVRTCRLQRTSYFRRCGSDACETQEWSDSTTLEFRLKGAVARHSHRNHDGSEWTTTYDYDDAGRLLMVRHANSGGLAGVTLHEYDTSNRLGRVLYQPQGREARTVEIYEYSITGCKKKTHFTDPAAERPITAWGIEGTDAAYGAQGAVTLTTQYNERDQPTEVLFLDSAGCQVSRVELRYDQAGHMVEESQTHADETLPAEMLASLNEEQRETVRALFGSGGKFVSRTHRYDSRGHRVETRFGMGPLGGDVKTLAYNDHGDVILEIEVRQEREFGLDDRGRLSETPTKERLVRSEARILYEYDARGNWVAKAVECRGSAEQEFKQSSVERRDLTYFE
jgi:hypothetical protein